MDQHDRDPDDRPGGRDGSSPRAAIPVGSVPEEYAWVARNHPGCTFAGQALLFVKGKPFDRLTLRLESGEEREVFFDISSFYDA
jgi:hypothetical protein